MRKKIYSMLALLCLTVSGAWAQEGTLLTTILSTGGNASFKSGSKTFDNIATVTFSGNVNNDNDDYGWYSGAERTLTVTAAEGYTITRVKFYSDSGSAFDEEAPFEAIVVYDDGNIAKVNGTSIGAYGVTKIEVYGYETPAAPAGYTVSMPQDTDDASNWTGKAGSATTFSALPLEGLSPGDAVTLKYSGRRKVKTVTATTDAGGESPAGPTGPTGAINGNFSVSATQTVFFSQGNLQYQASTNTWRFAENQYDYVGNANSNASETYSGWIDLFCYGTSGYNHGANCYLPWSNCWDEAGRGDNYLPNGWDANLYDGNGKADWGYNAISNGGNSENSGWRTMTQAEWNYLINTRTTTSGIRWAKGKVNNISGFIILPDDWSASTYTLNNTNGGNFSSNTISASDWADKLEANGAVFLPAAGYRDNTDFDYMGSYGFYWSASLNTPTYYYSFKFYNGGLYTDWGEHPCKALSVRLVRNP